MTPQNAPRTCPVCSERLMLTRLSCPSCSTELSGHFESCEFCSLSHEDRELLHVFLRSRGNMKEVERYLNVSYPTARARYDTLLGKLGIQADQPQPAKLDVLQQLARGEIDVDAALDQIS